MTNKNVEYHYHQQNNTTPKHSSKYRLRPDQQLTEIYTSLTANNTQFSLTIYTKHNLTLSY